MVIGILGNKGAGKSTLGKIIWGLIQGHSDSAIINSILLNTPLEVLKENQNFKFKKFADTLKDMLCVFLGCTREDLENEEFKDRQVGETIYKVQLKYVDKHGINRTIVFNDVYYTDSSVKSAIESHKKRNYNAVISNTNPVYEPLLIKVTPRYLMETLGNEWGRTLINPSVWAKKTFKDFIKYDLNVEVNTIPVTYGHYEGQYEIPAFYPNSGEITNSPVVTETISTYPDWIIDDVRMENEIKEILNYRDNIIIYIEKSEEDVDNNTNKPISEKANLYKSSATYLIENYGTLNDLLDKAKEIVKLIFERKPWIDITHLTEPVVEEVSEIGETSNVETANSDNTVNF